MADLVEFLTVQLDADEQLTRAAGSTRSGKVAAWHITHFECSHGPDAADDCYARRVEGDNITIYDEGGHDEDQARFIARWDPTAVLADIAAKRAIVEDCAKAVALGQRFHGDNEFAYQPVSRLALRTLKRLAASFSDRPGYKPDWRVE